MIVSSSCRTCFSQIALFLFAIGVLAVSTMAVSRARATTSGTFRFESVTSIDDMRKMIEADFPLGSSRALLRQNFVTEGAATQKIHPTQAGVEKYLYDINLCGYYIWRWNISADYDAGDHLLQAYVNGEPVYPAGKQKKDWKALAKSGNSSILKVIRMRPEANKGEKELSYLLLDGDGDRATIDDQVLTGSGPTRPDPFNLGKLHAYSNVEPWRSIFDFDNAAKIVNYQGSCSKVSKLYANLSVNNLSSNR